MNIVISLEFLDESVKNGWHPVGIGSTDDPEVAMNALMHPDTPRLKRGWIVTARENSEIGRLLGFAIVRNGKRRRMELATLQSRIGYALRDHYAKYLGIRNPYLDFEDTFSRQNTVNGMLTWAFRNRIPMHSYVAKIVQRIFDDLFAPEVLENYNRESQMFLNFFRLIREHRYDSKKLEEVMSEITSVYKQVDDDTRDILKSLRYIVFTFYLDSLREDANSDMINLSIQGMSKIINENNFKVVQIGAKTLTQAFNTYVIRINDRVCRIIYEEMTEQPFLLAMHQYLLIHQDD